MNITAEYANKLQTPNSKESKDASRYLLSLKGDYDKYMYLKSLTSLDKEILRLKEILDNND